MILKACILVGSETDRGTCRDTMYIQLFKALASEKPLSVSNLCKKSEFKRLNKIRAST